MSFFCNQVWHFFYSQTTLFGHKKDQLQFFVIRSDYKNMQEPKFKSNYMDLVCDGTASLKPNAGGKPHMLHMSGVFVGGQQVLARAQIAMQGENGGVVLKIAVRSGEADVSRMVADCIR